MNAAATTNNELDGFKAISTYWHVTDDELDKCGECTPFKSSNKLFHRRSKRRHFCPPDLLKDADVQLFETMLNATSTSKFDM